MHETGCSGLVHWDHPEGWNEEGGGRGVQDGEHMYTHGRFMLMYGFTLPVDPLKTQSVIPQVQFLFDVQGASQHLEQCMASDGH